MASEVAVALAWLYSTLSTDSQLSGYAPGGVWRAEAPPATTPPYIILIYDPASSHDAVVFGGGRAYSELLFSVMACGPAKLQQLSAQTIASAASRIDTLLTLAAQTAVTGGTILASFRISSLESDSIINGEVWTNIGGEYRIMIKAT